MQQLLEKQLNKRGYYQSEINRGFLTHHWRLGYFLLCVDDFGVKYFFEHNAEHLMTVLRYHYKISHDWRIKWYLGMDLDWDYDHRKVHLSMLSYVTDAHKRLERANPHKLKHQPYPYIKPNYDAKAQYA